MADKLVTKEFYTIPRDDTPLTNTNYHNNLVQKLAYILSDIQPKFNPENIAQYYINTTSGYIRLHHI